MKIQVARFSQKVIDFKSMCIESITATRVITRYDQQEFSFIRKNRCYYTETNCSFPCPAQLKNKELKGGDLLNHITKTLMLSYVLNGRIK